jgi:hypothetical protein
MLLLVTLIKSLCILGKVITIEIRIVSFCTLKSLRMFATMMETPLKEAPMTPVMGRACPVFQTPLLAAHEGELS